MAFWLYLLGAVNLEKKQCSEATVCALHCNQDCAPGFKMSHAATWDGPMRKLTEEEALKECVRFMWDAFEALFPASSEKRHALL